MIRPATLADLPEIQRIVTEQLYLDIPGFYWHETDTIERAIKAEAYWVVCQDHHIDAVLSIFPHGDAIWIDTLAVDTPKQGQGLAHKLILLARTLAVEAGLRWLRVTSYTQYGAKGAYTALGFRLVASHPDYVEFEMPVSIESAEE